MPFLVDQSGAYEAVRNDRTQTGNLAANNAETVFTVNGESTVQIDLRGTSTQSIIFEGSTDGTNYDSLPAFDRLSQQYVLSLALTAGSRVFKVQCAGYKFVKIRTTAYTSGNFIVAMRGSLAPDLITTIPLPAALAVTMTTAISTSGTLTLPAAGAGLYHYITRLLVQKFNAAVLIAAATPVLVTATNLPGTRVLSFPADAALQGTMNPEVIEPSQPLKSTTANTATTIVCPAITSVIWRVTADYYVGA